MMSHRNRLVVMAKYPSAGRVKTRLARDIGVAEALRFYRPQLARTCRTLANDPAFELVLSLSPAPRPGATRHGADRVIGQGRGDLGTRMQRLFDLLEPGPVIIIGADIPGVTQRMIRRAFFLLKGHQFVFGPADDGGFWLVGQRRAPTIIKAFDGVRWSSPDALQDTLGNLAAYTIATVDQLNDVDTGADL